MHVQKPALASSRVSFSSFRTGLLRRGKVYVRDQLRSAVEDGAPRLANRGRLRVVSCPATQDVPHCGARGIRLEGEGFPVHAGSAVPSRLQRTHDLGRVGSRDQADDM